MHAYDMHFAVLILTLTINHGGALHHRYVDREGELRKPRPPRPQSLFPMIARALPQSTASIDGGP